MCTYTYLLPSLCVHTRRKVKSSCLEAFANLRNAVPAADIDPFRGVYASAAAQLRSLLSVTDPYVRPTESRQSTPFTQKEFPEIRRDKFFRAEKLERSLKAFQEETHELLRELRPSRGVLLLVW